MSPVEARVLLLCAELERDWSEVLRNRTRAESADPHQSEHAAAFVALAIDHAYQSFETFLVRLERGLGLPARTGATWHRGLLEDAALEVGGLRPAIVPAAAAPDWTSVMAFRHFLRHAYSADLDAAQLVAARSALSRAVARTAPLVATMVASLRSDDP